MVTSEMRRKLKGAVLRRKDKPFGRNQKLAIRSMAVVGLCFVLPAYGVLLNALVHNDVSTQLAVVDKLNLFVGEFGVWAIVGVITVSGAVKGIQAGAAAWASRK